MPKHYTVILAWARPHKLGPDLKTESLVNKTYFGPFTVFFDIFNLTQAVTQATYAQHGWADSKGKRDNSLIYT